MKMINKNFEPLFDLDKISSYNTAIRNNIFEKVDDKKKALIGELRRFMNQQDEIAGICRNPGPQEDYYTDLEGYNAYNYFDLTCLDSYFGSLNKKKSVFRKIKCNIKKQKQHIKKYENNFNEWGEMVEARVSCRDYVFIEKLLSRFHDAIKLYENLLWIMERACDIKLEPDH